MPPLPLIKTSNLLSRFTRNASFSGKAFLFSSLGSNIPSSADFDDRVSSDSCNEETRSKIVIFGGNGFVGSNVCEEAVKCGFEVTSISRSGNPPIKRENEPWVERVHWAKGNLLHSEEYSEILIGASAAISCVGAFGSNEYMLRINGRANEVAIDAASNVDGLERFVYVSAHDFSFPSFVLRGYFEGKKAAESAVLHKFPHGGVILRPGMIYGTRHVGNMSIPLGIVGRPIETIFLQFSFASQVPIVGSLFVPPVDVKNVAIVAVKAATNHSIASGVISAWQIPQISI